MAGRKDGQNLFHRIIPATVGGLTSTAAVDWYLKVKHIEYNVCLPENYCITVNMQKISLIHTWPHPFFDHTHPKISEITFSFPEFAPACKKPVH